MSQDTEGQAIESFLADRDEACPSCDYGLRSLKTGTCPECRATIRIEVARPLPVHWHAIGTAACGMVFGGTAVQLIRDYYTSGPYSFYVNGTLRETINFVWPWSSWPDLVAAAGSIGTLTIWMSLWRRLRTCRSGTRWTAIAAVVATSLGWLQFAWWPFPFFGP